jgi:alpha-beta hydrolase superfamily lysophospholipase
MSIPARRPLRTQGRVTTKDGTSIARRGRGASGDTLPYAVQREVEDIEALLAMAGGKAHLYGVSSGGALVREAALAVSMGDDHASRNGEKQ